MKTANYKKVLVVMILPSVSVSKMRNFNPLLKPFNSAALCFLAALGLFALCSSSLPAQTLSSGGNYGGLILLNQTNSWTFTASSGDRLVLRGAALTITNNFYPWLRIYNPNGALIGDNGAGSSAIADELALTATNSGNFTVLVSDSGYGGYVGTGDYRLTFARMPGAFSVPGGDEGGALTNGGIHKGTIQLGDLDLWSFTAAVGDRVVIRVGALTATNYFNTWFRIYNPSGVLVADSGGGSSAVADELALTSTNSGTFTVLVTDSDYGGDGGTGDYQLYFAQFPGTFVVPSGDEGGTLTSGNNYDGTIQLGDLDLWSFTAAAGDRIVIRVGALTATNYFNTWFRIYNPSGVLVSDSGAGSSAVADELALTATNSGTFTVLVTDSDYGGDGGTGAYRLYFSQFPAAFAVPVGDEGGPLTSGSNYDATIQLGDLDLWSFTAATGDRVVVRAGTLTATNYFNLWLRVYNPNGVMVADSGGGSSDSAQELAVTATNGGSYTVLVTDSDYGGDGGTGAYRLYFSKFPGPFVVPPGDEGGALTSGGNYPGTIQVGDEDLWSFTANTGDRFVVRFGARTFTNYFNPWMRIYSPSGVLIADSGAGNFSAAEELAVTATNSGTFFVLLADSVYGGNGGSGDYVLYFAQTSGAFIVPVGDEGGSLTNGVDNFGALQVGDLDLYRFTACRGDIVTLQMDALTPTNYFNPWVRLYNPSGVLIGDSGGGSFAATGTVTVRVTNSGPFIVLLGDSAYGGVDGSGTYKLTSNGLSDGLKMCFPIISGTNVTLSAVGGGSNATYVLFTETNVTASAAVWTPVRTNQFDNFGVFSWTNSYDKAAQRYYRLRSP
jgi:cysteine synthase